MNQMTETYLFGCGFLFTDDFLTYWLVSLASTQGFQTTDQTRTTGDTFGGLVGT